MKLNRAWLSVGIIAVLLMATVAVACKRAEYQEMALAGGVSNLSMLHLAAPTSAGSATPALMVDCAGVNNCLEVRDAATPVVQVADGGAVTFTGIISTTPNIEHYGLPTIASAAVVSTTTDGALFTVADGEIWLVHAAWVQVTTNFDCTGDDCTLVLGDGNDTDGFCTLADAELQAADTVGTGFAAGWQCMEAAKRGVYLDEAANNGFTGGFVYAPSGAAETIDVDVGGTDVAAGAATVYVLYTRIQ